MAKRRKITGEADARRSLAAAKASGKPPREWAHRHGIDARSLHAWRVILARREAAADRRRPQATGEWKRGLVELVPTSRVAVASVSRAEDGARYVLGVSGLRLEFGDDCSAATLARVISVLRSC